MVPSFSLLILSEINPFRSMLNGGCIFHWLVRCNMTFCWTGYRNLVSNSFFFDWLANHIFIVVVNANYLGLLNSLSRRFEKYHCLQHLAVFRRCRNFKLFGNFFKWILFIRSFRCKFLTQETYVQCSDYFLVYSDVIFSFHYFSRSPSRE